MISESLAIPVAIGPGNRVYNPDHAQKGQSYSCPECQERVILKRGQIRVPHFAHTADSNCNPETVLHKAGKANVCAVVVDWKNSGGPKPEIVWHHPHCGKIENLVLDDEVTGAHVEHRLKSGRVLDVAICAGESIHLGVEVYVTHRVDASKKSAVECPWIELDAEDLVRQPLSWKVRQFGNCLSPDCRDCLEFLERERARIAAIQASYPKPRTTYFYTTEASQERLHRGSPRPPEVNRPGTFHPTTLVAMPVVEWSLATISKILDHVDPPREQVECPGGGVVNAYEFACDLREELGRINALDTYQKRCLLWKLGEYLEACGRYVRGDTPSERDRRREEISLALAFIRRT